MNTENLGVKNLGLNRLGKDEYNEMMDDNSSTPFIAVKSIQRTELVERNQYLKMLDIGKTIKLHKLLSIIRKSRTNEQYNDAMSMTIGFEPEAKLLAFQNEIGLMYNNVIKSYIDRECPEEIFDTGLYSNTKADFIEFTMSASKKGRDLRKLEDLYLDFIIVS